MADDRADETVTCTVLAGPDGSVYCFSDETLEAHRLADDVATSLREAYESGEAEVHGFGLPGTPPAPAASGPDLSSSLGSFNILGKGPVTRRGLQTVPTMDTWFDL